MGIEDVTRGCFGCVKRCRDYIARSAFLDRNLAAVVLGIVLGLIIKFSVTLSEQDNFYISFPGEFILHALHVVTTPFLMTSMAGAAHLFATSGKITAPASAYFALTTLLSVTLGSMLALSIEPGVDAMRKEDTEDKKIFSFLDVLLDLVWNLAPEIWILDFNRQYKTEMFELEIEADEQHLTLEQNATQVRIVRQVEATNMLGMMLWSYLIGLSITRARIDVLFEMYTSFDEAARCVVHWILGFVPFGIVFLVIGIVVEADDWEIAIKLGKFMGVVVCGLIIHGSVVLPLVYFLFTKCNPYTIIKEVFPALKTALIVCSSSATLPLTYQCCEERLKIDERISRLILPISTNIKMDGTVLYEVVGVVFVAQINHIDLDLNKLIFIAFTLAVTSIRVTGIAARGPVTTFFILSAVDFPANEACLLVLIQCLIVRCNTVINVMGDCIGMALIQQLSKGDLEDIKEQEQEMERMHGSDA